MNVHTETYNQSLEIVCVDERAEKLLDLSTHIYYMSKLVLSMHVYRLSHVMSPSFCLYLNYKTSDCECRQGTSIGSLENVCACR